VVVLPVVVVTVMLRIVVFQQCCNWEGFLEVLSLVYHQRIHGFGLGKWLFLLLSLLVVVVCCLAVVLTIVRSAGIAFVYWFSDSEDLYSECHFGTKDLIHDFVQEGKKLFFVLTV